MAISDSWMGGHFERMISVVKSSLVVSLRHKTLNEEEFRTAVRECQAVVNNRPLTYLSNSTEDEPLMPSHLLQGTLMKTLPLAILSEEEEEYVSPGKKAPHQHVMLLQARQYF